jgi:ribosomal protein L11 methyltransferase
MSQSIISLQAEELAAKRISTLIEAAMEEEFIALSLSETEPDSKMWSVDLYIETDQSEHALNQLRACLGGDLFGIEPKVTPVEDKDWVTESLMGLPPVRAGRFVVHGDHDRDAVKPHEFGVEINAGQAFGTGHHGTTAGCLDMLEWVLKRQKPAYAFDVGTGSGVLAIALAKAVRIPVAASDIDPVSSRICAENAKLNGVGGYIEAFTATGFEHETYRQTPPAPLVIANILAGPLARLAPQMEQNLAKGGILILSGLLPHQRSKILAAYNAQGLYHLKSHYRDGWLTLVLQG